MWKWFWFRVKATLDGVTWRKVLRGVQVPVEHEDEIGGEG